MFVISTSTVYVVRVVVDVNVALELVTEVVVSVAVNVVLVTVVMVTVVGSLVVVVIIGLLQLLPRSCSFASTVMSNDVHMLVSLFHPHSETLHEPSRA